MPVPAEALEPVPRFTAEGLKNYDVAPTSRAKCMICSKYLLVGTYRLSYRHRVSMAMGDVRRLHPACAPGLPTGPGRAASIVWLRHMLADDEKSLNDIAMLRSVFDALQA